MTRSLKPHPRTATAGRRASLADRLFSALHREIIENRLPPDTILGEANVAATYGVSRAPAREALKRLAALGFVRTIPRLGYVVTSITLHDFDEIMALRFALEPLAVELAVPRLTAEHLAELERLATVDVSAEPPERQAILHAQLNADFHRLIAEVSGNRRLAQTISGLIDELERVMHGLVYSNKIDLVLPQHLALAQVMRTADAVAAARLMREQLEVDYELMRGLASPPTARSLSAPPTLSSPAAAGDGSSVAPTPTRTRRTRPRSR